MKKLFLFFTAVWFAAGSVQAEDASGIFSDDTFTVAAALKIGRNKGVVTAPAYTWVDTGVAPGPGPGPGPQQDVCSFDSDCDPEQKCNSKNKCVDACSDVACVAGSTCFAENHKGICKAPCERAEVAKVCTDKGYKCVNDGASFKCVQCTQHSDCGSNGRCLKKINGGVCITIRPLCSNVTCNTGFHCSLGRCVAYPLGSTDDPQCTDKQVADGNGGCKDPCDGVTCPLGKQCTVGSGTGKACCGDCEVNLVARTTQLNNLYTKLNITTAKKPLIWNKKLNLCLPKFEAVDININDFKYPKLRKPFIYTGLIKQVEDSDILTGSNKTVVKLLETSLTDVSSSTLTLDNVTKIKADPVVYQAVTLPADTTTLSVQKTKVSAATAELLTR